MSEEQRESESPEDGSAGEPCELAQPLRAFFSNDYPSILRLARARLARERGPVSAGTLAQEL